jgi:hypothetical protein
MVHEHAGAQQSAPLLEECDYQHFPNPIAKDTYWKIKGKRRAVYVRGDLSPQEQQGAKDKLGSAENQ